MSDLRERLRGAYAQLATRGRLRTRAELETVCDAVARELRFLVQSAGDDPDAIWSTEVPLVPAPFPAHLYVSEEQDNDGTKFLIAQEQGIHNCSDGTPLGIYRLEKTARVKVTVEVETGGATPQEEPQK